MTRRLLCLPAAILLALLLSSSALAAKPGGRIVNGTEAAQGEYPAQGFLGINTDADPTFESFCGGTLVGSRQFLTAAHCVTNSVGIPRPAASFTVRLGNVDRNASPPDDYSVVVGGVDLNTAYNSTTFQNDTAMLTLSRPASYEPMRVVGDNEDALWAPGTAARIIGWGTVCFDICNDSDFLLKANVPMVTDERCANAYGADFDPTVMVCAADAEGTPPGSSHDTCQGDSGGPLLAPDGGFFALSGTVSWGDGCADPAKPGVYARIGDQPLNKWVHDRTPEADFTFDHAPRANEPVTLTSTSHHPDDPDGFTTFSWDLDNDEAFDDASGTSKSVTHTFPTAGEAIVGLEASKPSTGDKASIYYSFEVGADPNAPAPVVTPPATVSSTPPPAVTKPTVRLATILNAKRPKVSKKGRFKIRVTFAASAPAGTAVVEVYRGKRKVGTAKGFVRRGGSRQMTIKLNKTGRKLLKRSKTKRLKVRVQVRVGKQLLRSKTLTIQR
jgi:trypsin